jgi:pimeloyl-ACP methyl ester carboxylesterase
LPTVQGMQAVPALFPPYMPHLAHMPLQGCVKSGDVNLAIRRWGDPRRTTIVLVHGYPDSSEVWLPLAKLLADEFHVVAYDVRGAGDSDKPFFKGAYQLPQLMADFKAVIDQVSPNAPVHVVAHDWGSIQSWESVTDDSLKGRIASFTSCSGPCLDHMGHWFRDRLRKPTAKGLGEVFKQSFKSWYIYLFQLPVVPNLIWRLGMGAAWPSLLRWLEGVKVKGRAGQASDGSHGVQLYRANMLPRLLFPRERHAHAPVQLLVPKHDLYVSPALTQDLSRWVKDLTRREFNAGHWMPLTHASEMAGAVRRFIRQVERQSHQTTPAQAQG